MTPRWLAHAAGTSLCHAQEYAAATPCAALLTRPRRCLRAYVGARAADAPPLLVTVVREGRCADGAAPRIYLAVAEGAIDGAIYSVQRGGEVDAGGGALLAMVSATNRALPHAMPTILLPSAVPLSRGATGRVGATAEAAREASAKSDAPGEANAKSDAPGEGAGARVGPPKRRQGRLAMAPKKAAPVDEAHVLANGSLFVQDEEACDGAIGTRAAVRAAAIVSFSSDEEGEAAQAPSRPSSPPSPLILSPPSPLLAPPSPPSPPSTDAPAAEAGGGDRGLPARDTAAPSAKRRRTVRVAQTFMEGGYLSMARPSRAIPLMAPAL